MPAPRYFELAHRRGGELADPVALLGIQRGRGGFLEHLLVAALQRAVALAEMHAGAAAVAQHLDLDMARPAEILLEVDGVVAEGGLGLGAGQREGLARRLGVLDHLHAAAAAAGHRLDQHRIADLLAERHDLVDRADRPGRARHQRQAELLGGLLGHDLVAHHADVLRRGADEGEAVRLDRFGEAGVLRQEAVAGMDGVGAGDGRGRQDRRDVEVAVARRRRADADRFVGQAHMHGVAVGGRMHRHGLDAHLAAGAVDA